MCSSILLPQLADSFAQSCPSGTRSAGSLASSAPTSSRDMPIRWAYLKRVLAGAIFGLYITNLLYFLNPQIDITPLRGEGGDSGD